MGLPAGLSWAANPHAPNERTASHLFRIAQEAVRNAVKHAHPKHVDIVLAADGRTLTLTVSDDGSGLPRRRRGPGMGLRIMAHRAEMIRGEFEVESGLDRRNPRELPGPGLPEDGPEMPFLR